MVRIGVNTPLLTASIAAIGVYETMRRVAAIGYSYIELSLFRLSPENVRELMRAEKDFGVRVVAASVDIEPQRDLLGANPRLNLAENFDEFVAICRSLGCRHARTYLYGTGEFGSRATILAYAAKFEAAAKRLAEVGIDYSYHPHNFEFAKHDGTIGLRIMRDATELAKFEICSYWVQSGGLDTGKILREFGSDGRVSICHLKDYRIARVDNTFLAEHYSRENPRALLTDVLQFAEAGEGNLDIADIMDAADEIGAEYIFLEQDCLYGRAELEVLATDYENLCAMGYRGRM